MPVILIKPSLSMSFPRLSREQSTRFNCLAHALNVPHIGWVMPRCLLPPHQREQQDGAWTVQALHRILCAGGLVPADTNSDPAKVHLIAAWIGHAFDMKYDEELHLFHVARRDGNGIWSDKDGAGVPRNRVLGIPAISARLLHSFKYQQFVGYFRIPDSGIHYYPGASRPVAGAALLPYSG